MSIEKRFNILAKMYIDDTSLDGQLFCGCRKEDCENFKTRSCVNCLIRHIDNRMKTSTIKGIEWHDMSTKPYLNGESRDISEVVLISMEGDIIDGLAHYDYEVEAWYADGVEVEHKLVEPKYWAYR